MNETDNPRNDRRRSSRGRRRRSGGGDRSAQTPNKSEAVPRKAPSSTAAGDRPARNSKQNDRQARGKERNGRDGDPSRGASSNRSDASGRGSGRGGASSRGGSSRSAASGGNGSAGSDRNQNRPRRADQTEAARSAAAAARDRLSAPRIAAPTLPKPLCPRCGAPIEDLPSALNDKESGAPIHFDCVLARLSEAESLAEGEKVVYLGGGRFGVVLFENPGDLKRFRVRKIIQWEEKDKRADWRRLVTDLYSAT